MSLICKKCGSSHVQAVKVILDSGTSSGSGAFSGYGVGTSNSGVVTGVTSTYSQTNLASRFNPPEKGKSRGAYILWIFLFGMLAISFGGLLEGPKYSQALYIIWGILGILFYYAIQKNEKKIKAYNKNIGPWRNLYENGFFCHQCGSVFDIR